jgi:outer membrane lipoprotein-sorting protein
MSRLCLLCAIFLLFAACRSQNEPAITHNALSEAVISATPPFQTKEPDRYRATRLITIVTPAGKTMVTKTSIAKDGEMRREELENVTYLNMPDGRFVLLPAEKVYADVETNSDTGDDEEFSPERLLHDEATKTSYQKIGTEPIHERNATKYRIVVNSATSGSVTVSETLIWIDEILNIPIRSETTSADGTKVTMELSDVSLDVDNRVFQVPNDYQKVAFSELYKRWRKTD